MLAAPDFQGVGFDAEIGGGFMSVEFGFAGHDGFSFLGFAGMRGLPAGFEGE
jgi:hypothetical protein